jgi:hypothetical protein
MQLDVVGCDAVLRFAVRQVEERHACDRRRSSEWHERPVGRPAATILELLSSELHLLPWSAQTRSSGELVLVNRSWRGVGAVEVSAVEAALPAAGLARCWLPVIVGRVVWTMLVEVAYVRRGGRTRAGGVWGKSLDSTGTRAGDPAGRLRLRVMLACLLYRLRCGVVRLLESSPRTWCNSSTCSWAAQAAVSSRLSSLSLLFVS